MKKTAIEDFILNTVSDEILQPSNVRQGLAAIEEEASKERMDANGRLATLEGQVKHLEEELSRYQKAISQGVDSNALAEPMNGCYERLAEARAAWNEVESLNLADFQFTDDLVEEVIQAARCRLMGGSSEQTKHYLRELMKSVEVVSDEVTIRYTFSSPHTKVAYRLAPHPG